MSLNRGRAIARLATGEAEDIVNRTGLVDPGLNWESFKNSVWPDKSMPPAPCASEIKRINDELRVKTAKEDAELKKGLPVVVGLGLLLVAALLW